SHQSLPETALPVGLPLTAGLGDSSAAHFIPGTLSVESVWTYSILYVQTIASQHAREHRGRCAAAVRPLPAMPALEPGEGPGAGQAVRVGGRARRHRAQAALPVLRQQELRAGHA